MSQTIEQDPDDYSLEHKFIEANIYLGDKCWFCGYSYKKHKPNDRTRESVIRARAGKE